MAADRSNGGPDAGPPPASPDELIERVQQLTAELERVADPTARRVADELVAAVIELYGEGLQRMFAAVAASPDADELGERLAADGVVASLMLIHDLYPVALEERVAEALASVRPYMESHGGNVELLGIEDGIARIRLEGSCEGCPASASTLELAIKSALDEAAPDLEGLVVEGAVAPRATPAGPGAIRLPVVGVAAGAAKAAPSWSTLEGFVEPPDDELSTVDIDGRALVVARVDGDLLAFLDACAGCGASMADAELREGTLRCGDCGRRYFLPRAGRSLDDDRLLLEPVPLLAGADGPRVALPKRAPVPAPGP
jgi:Fe-S cluster biogenesis protein NfuA/nitrite reductase/ring-hydroxylating ferredoxin subunit